MKENFCYKTCMKGSFVPLFSCRWGTLTCILCLIYHFHVLLIIKCDSITQLTGNNYICLNFYIINVLFFLSDVSFDLFKILVQCWQGCSAIFLAFNFCCILLNRFVIHMVWMKWQVCISFLCVSLGWNLDSFFLS